MHGYGERFGASDKITQGQFMAVLCRMLDIQNAEPDTSYEYGLQLGLIKDNEQFRYDRNLSRGDMANM